MHVVGCDGGPQSVAGTRRRGEHRNVDADTLSGLHHLCTDMPHGSAPLEVEDVDLNSIVGLGDAEAPRPRSDGQREVLVGGDTVPAAATQS